MQLALYVSDNFQKSFKKLTEAELPVKTSFKISKFAKAIQPEVETFVAERKKVFDKYGKQVEGQPEGTMQLDADKHEEWMPALQELEKLESDVKLELSMDDLGDDVKLSASDLMILESLFQD
jgi:hypothetical protein